MEASVIRRTKALISLKCGKIRPRLLYTLSTGAKIKFNELS